MQPRGRITPTNVRSFPQPAFTLLGFGQDFREAHEAISAAFEPAVSTHAVLQPGEEGRIQPRSSTMTAMRIAPMGSARAPSFLYVLTATSDWQRRTARPPPFERT